jgi:hypothetical protein
MHTWKAKLTLTEKETHIASIIVRILKRIDFKLIEKRHSSTVKPKRKAKEQLIGYYRTNYHL